MPVNMITNQVVRSSWFFRSLVSSVRLTCAQRLCTKPNLSVFRTIPFPPTKLEVQSVLESWTDTATSVEACAELHEGIKAKRGSGSFWSHLLKTSAELNRVSFAESVLDFILTDPTKHNSATIICALQLLVSRKRFPEFQSLYAALLPRLSESELQILIPPLIGLLAQTPSWKQGFDLLSLLPSSETGMQLRKMITGAVTYGSQSDIFSILERLVQDELPPTSECFNTLFRRFALSDESVDVASTINRLLMILQKTHWSIPYESAHTLRDWFSQRPGWHAELGIQLRKNECPVCECKLPILELTSESVKNMAEEFYQRIFKGTSQDDLYLSTTPSELASLNRFLADQTQPFDCVVDFLNVMHLFHIAFEPQTAGKAIGRLLLRLHRDFNVHRFCLVGKGNKVIRHRLFWNTLRNLGDQTGISVFSFVTQNKSQDDVFMLYLALWSGPNCYLVSNDEFRQHRFTLGLDMNLKLSHWQAIRQIAAQPGTSTPYLDPVKCDTKVHGNMKAGWHIPYEDNTQRRSYVPPNTWLCAAPQKNPSAP